MPNASQITARYEMLSDALRATRGLTTAAERSVTSKALDAAYLAALAWETDLQAAAAIDRGAEAMVRRWTRYAAL